MKIEHFREKIEEKDKRNQLLTTSFFMTNTSCQQVKINSKIIILFINVHSYNPNNT